MKKILLIVLFSTFVFALSITQGVSGGCAAGALYLNLMGNKESVNAECKECINNTPLMNIDKTNALMQQMTDDCVARYFEYRNKTKK